MLQFRGRDGAAFLLDPGSTHGTYLNKQRLPAGKHVPLRCDKAPRKAVTPSVRLRFPPSNPHLLPPPPLRRVGDQVRFGESTRLFVLEGPTELMPDEGPSREDKMKAAALKVCLGRGAG